MKLKVTEMHFSSSAFHNQLAALPWGSPSCWCLGGGDALWAPGIASSFLPHLSPGPGCLNLQQQQQSVTNYATGRRQLWKRKRRGSSGLNSQTDVSVGSGDTNTEPGVRKRAPKTFVVACSSFSPLSPGLLNCQALLEH